MGFTRYWDNANDIAPIFWADIVDAAAVIIDAADGVVLANGGATIREDRIKLNGAGNSGCEAFELRRAAGGGFCKTNRLPYDGVVSAILNAAAAIIGEGFTVLSD